MTAAAALNRVRRAFYLDSVALMRLSQEVAALPGIETASLMIGTAANKAILDEAGLLAEAGRAAGANDLIVAVRAADAAAGEGALDHAAALLDRPAASAGDSEWRPRSLDTAIEALPGANLALISVPGAFAAREARRALGKGLHVMIFSDNVAVEDERALKQEAVARGLLVMGPDCGTALIGGVPLAFANAVPRGAIGIVSASGTGLQEVSTLIARAGKGVSHGIGVGGRDLGDAVGGLMTLAAIDALDADAATGHIVLISKPPSPAVAERVFARIGESAKPFTVSFIGMEETALPANARFAATLKAAAEAALGSATAAPDDALVRRAGDAASRLSAGRRWIRGLYCGGTLCAEAQTIVRAGGETVASNAPVPGAGALSGDGNGHTMIDFGADQYTIGRPHPMIDPAVRAGPLADALADPAAAIVLLDVVIGYGAHHDPAGAVADGLTGGGPAVVASVCGTEGDPQTYSGQVARLEESGVLVAPSNADAAAIALSIARRTGLP